MIGPRLGFAVFSVDDTAAREITAMAGPTGVDHPEVLAPVVIPESQIDLILQGLGRTTSRIWVVDRDHRVLAQTGTLKPPQHEISVSANAGPVGLARLWHNVEEATLRRIYAQVLPQPSEDFEEGTQEASGLLASVIDEALKGVSVSRWRMTADKRAVVLSAAHPIQVSEHAAGAVVVEETTNAILSVRTQALETLFSTALIVLLLGTLTLFVFATRLSARIHRLRDEAEQVVDQQGRVRGIIASSTAGDEIGDLSRSFSTILHRLADYNAYLEHLGSRLAHEIRTPIAVVRSSLDNLRLQAIPGEAGIYLDRAQQGLTRLSRVVTAMVEATRIEQAMQQAERERFDLAAVVEGSITGYRLAYPDAAFDFISDGTPVLASGVPDLIAQMLDKLVANAIEFRAAGTTVRVGLLLAEARAQLDVVNDGPLLPAQMEGRLFQSMVSLRSHQTGSDPHLGMGLYIVRLIAEFHGGTASICNREDGGGVIATVLVPAVVAQ
jgi:dedicated sortase system histidine kinase